MSEQDVQAAVGALPVFPWPDRDSLGQLEDAVLDRLDPPLNLAGRPSTSVRQALSRQRAALVGRHAPERHGPDTAAPAQLTVVTWNVNGRVGSGQARQAETLLALEPDAIALQEVTAASYPAWRERLSHAGYSVLATIDLLALPYRRISAGSTAT